MGPEARHAGKMKSSELPRVSTAQRGIRTSMGLILLPVIGFFAGTRKRH